MIQDLFANDGDNYHTAYGSLLRESAELAAAAIYHSSDLDAIERGKFMMWASNFSEIKLDFTMAKLQIKPRAFANLDASTSFLAFRGGLRFPSDIESSGDYFVDFENWYLISGYDRKHLMRPVGSVKKNSYTDPTTRLRYDGFVGGRMTAHGCPSFEFETKYPKEIRMFH